MQALVFYTFLFIILLLPLWLVRFFRIKSREFKEIRMYFDFFTEINIKEFAVIECIDVLDIDIEGYILDDINQVQSSWNDKAYALKEGKYRITCSFKYLTGGGAYNRYSFENKTQKVSEIFTLEKGKLYRFRILECSAVFNNKIPYKIVLSKSLENEKKKLTIVFEERIV